VSEPIIENYELEQWEEKQYAENIATNTDSNSLQSQKSIGNNQQNNNSFESVGNGTAYVSPPHSAGAQPHASYPGAPTSGGGGDSRRRGHTLAEKRSFLVRMVSDPKCYNPKIVRHLNMRSHKQMSQDLFRDRTLT